MTVDFTKSTHTVGGTPVVFVEDRGTGDYPLIFDLFCQVRRQWFAQLLYSREGQAALTFACYDLAPPDAPVKNLLIDRRCARSMQRQIGTRPARGRVVKALFNQKKEGPA